MEDFNVYNGLSTTPIMLQGVALDVVLLEVTLISNNIEDPQTSQSSFNNDYLKISLSGNVQSTTNYLSHIDVITNSLSTVNLEIGHISYVKILDESENVFYFQYTFIQWI